MIFIKRVICFFNKIFHKNEIKLLDESTNNIIFENKTIDKEEIGKQEIEPNKLEFIDSIKVGASENDILKVKKKVKTMICTGDGLGIINRLSA